MNWCQAHWDRLRALIDERGLTALVASGGELAAEQMRSQLEQGESTATNFDPLIHAWAAVNFNAMETISKSGNSPLYLLAPPGSPEDPVEGHPGRTWPRCPVCYLGLAHEISCTDPRCKLPKVDGYAWMLKRAADDAKARAIELGLAS